MTSLACYLKDLGNKVIGSDSDEIYFTDTILQDKNIQVLLFDENNITSEYIYIISRAYDYRNKEVAKIILNDFKHYYYDTFIGSILNKEIIGISGTHGKTTSAYFLAQMLNNKVSYIIGDGSGYGTNQSNFLVVEACEYQEHFLSYKPTIALITNIDFDHPDYFLSLESTINSFQAFANQSKVVVINNDDVNAKKIVHPNLVKFGFSLDSDYLIKIIKKTKKGYVIKVVDQKENIEYIYPFDYFGLHLVYDFVGSIVCSLLLGVTPRGKVNLPRRRLKEYACHNIILIDDYAHHPTEIKCLYETVKEKYPSYKYHVIFQPHTYSRTLALLDDFKTSLSLFDEVYIASTFASSREKESKVLEEEVKKGFNNFCVFSEDIINQIDSSQKEVWIFLGAGVINKYILNILEKNKV